MIRITARHLTLGDGFVAFMRAALRKRIEKFTSKTRDPEVVINRNGDRFKVEINYRYKKRTILATDTKSDSKKAFLGAMDKLRRQLEKTHEQRTDHSHADPHADYGGYAAS